MHKLKFLGLGLACVLAFGTVNAQSKDSTKTTTKTTTSTSTSKTKYTTSYRPSGELPGERAGRMADYLNMKFKLTPEQYSKVYSMYLDSYSKKDASGNFSMTNPTDAQLGTVLSKDQMTTYAGFKDSMATYKPKKKRRVRKTTTSETTNTTTDTNKDMNKDVKKDEKKDMKK